MTQESSSGPKPGLLRVAEHLEWINHSIGVLVAWLALAMVLMTFVVVVLRYVFDSGSIALQESVTYMYAILFMLGAAYTLQQDGHVRVDILYQRFSRRGRAWVNLLGTLFLLVPVSVFLIFIGAAIFSLVFRGFGGDELVTEFLGDLPGGAVALVMLVLFLLGFILDFIEITFVVVPIVGPVLLAMGLDPVWLGVMIAINLQTSFLTPPFGFALFYLRGVAPPELSTGQIYRGVAPFILIQLLMLATLALFPGLATWLPGQVYQ